MEKYDIIKASDLQDTLWGLRSTIANLQTAVDGKSDTGHTHTISQVDSLQSTLDGKLSWNKRVLAPIYTFSATNPNDPFNFYLPEKEVGELAIGLYTYKVDDPSGKANYFNLSAPVSGSLYCIAIDTSSGNKSSMDMAFYSGGAKILDHVGIYNTQSQTVKFMCLRLK